MNVKDIPNIADIDFDSLSGDAIESMPRDYSFSAENWAEGGPDASGWDSREPFECEGCGEVVIGSLSAECDNEQCENYGQTIGEDGGPMMNYYYPLPAELSDDEIAQLVHVPLVYVTVDDEPALALSGGGMDLSWEICEAFIRLGYLPPLHFSDLPRMAGRGENAGDKAIVRACVLSAEIAATRASVTAQSVGRLLGEDRESVARSLAKAAGNDWDDMRPTERDVYRRQAEHAE